MRLSALFWFLPVLLWSLVCSATDTDSIIEKVNTGNINWTRSIITANGGATPSQASPGDTAAVDAISMDRMISLAHERAKNNLLLALDVVRMNADGYLADIMEENPTIYNKVAEIAMGVPIAQTNQLENGDIEVMVELLIPGGFSQLVLPKEIKQVEYIKPINTQTQPETALEEPDNPSASTGAYSGVIIDARGIEARPAMVPVILDESGREVYSPAFISREYAVQNGVCVYIHSTDALQQIARIAPNPLLLRGLRTQGQNQCNIVISDADAFKLRDSSTNLHFLKQCRVVIIIDEID